MQKPDADDLDAILESTLEDIESQEKQKIQSQKERSAAPTPATQTPAITPLGTPSAAAGPAPKLTDQDEALVDEFTKGMSKLMEELSKGDFEKTFEEITKKMDSANPGGPTPAPAAPIDSSAKPAPSEEALRIERTLQQLSENARKLQQQQTGRDANTDELMMQKMMEQFDSNPQFNSMLESMMQQLMSREVLYAPMKEMKEKYPVWLAANSSKLPAADVERYQKQYQYVSRICVIYETEPNNVASVIQLMHEMQEYGQPPPEIVKELAPDVDLPEGANPLAGFPGLPPGADGKNCSVM